MSIYIKNLTSSVIYISDLGISILPNDTYEYLDIFNLRDSSEILMKLSNETICLNNDIKDLIGPDAIKFIYSSIDQAPKDRSGKIRVHQTARKLGTIVYFSGAGDNISDLNNIGDGEDFIFEHKIGEPVVQTKYFDFNTIDNETWFQEGYLIWSGAQFDRMTMSIVSSYVDVLDGTNTNFYKHPSGLIVPVEGTGNITITNDLSLYRGGLVFMPLNDLGEPEIGYWDADWNSTIKKFENIRPNVNGTGKYNIFWKEVEFARFINKIPLLNNGFERLQSNDSDQLGHGMRLKGTIETRGDDHAWKVASVLCMFRKNTA